jgi:hypothetical protein
MVSVCMRYQSQIINVKYVEVTRNEEIILHLADGTKNNVKITEIKYITD